eukprot:1151311-Pelagomonas_calceolata.AAC.4
MENVRGHISRKGRHCRPDCAASRARQIVAMAQVAHCPLQAIIRPSSGKRARQIVAMAQVAHCPLQALIR